MFLRRIRIKNLRSLADIELTFGSDGRPRRWTMLLGENGCGKSTLLRAIALVTAGSDALPELIGDPQSWIRNSTPAAFIEADIETAEGQPRNLEIRFLRGENIRSFFDSNRDTLNELDRALGHNAANYLTVAYGASRRINVGRESQQRSSTFRTPRAQSVATLFSADAQLSSVESWAFDVHYRQDDAGLSVIEDALRDLLPGVIFKGIDKTRRELIFETADGRVPLEQLSDGYQNMTGWCGDLLFRITEAYGHYRDPLSARGLLLIDEIDLHLHPTWQRRLREFIDDKLPNFQIVGTTHSPLTAQQTGENELYFLRREADREVHIHAYEGAARNLMIHQVLLSPMFGLATMDSKVVEDMKHEYRTLRDRTDLVLPERKRLVELESVLSTMPDWSRGSELDLATHDLLENVEQYLKASR